MRTRLLGIWAFALVVIAVGASAQAAASNSSTGTWKLDVAKSTYSPGPAPKSSTAKIEVASPDGIKVTVDGVGADGKPTHLSYTAQYDGKDVPITGSPIADTIALRRIDANTTESTLKNKGKVVGSSRVVVSADGKTRTMTTDGTTADGKPSKNVLVFEKQ